MTQEQKQLLLKDLCARLPYGVKILDIPANVVGDLFLVSTTDTVEYETNDGTGNQTLYNIKPYLRPMSSMTKEERNEATQFEINNLGPVGFNWGLLVLNSSKLENWLNAHYLDYHDLIPMGLALEAPKDMYKTE